MFVSKRHLSQKGMAATEYIIGLILVAVASVGVFAAFGTQIKGKVTEITAVISGNAEANKSHDVTDKALLFTGEENSMNNMGKTIKMDGTTKP